MEMVTENPHPRTEERPSSTVLNIGSLLLFFLLTIIAAWPVVSNLDSVIVGKGNDVYINPWADWWTAKALSDPDISLYQTNYLFYPNGANLIYHSFSHLNTLVSLALRPFFGALPAYNLTILLNLVLNGFSMFQLARYLTRSSTAGILAGIVFAFNSQTTFQSAHPVLFSVWCLPWLTLFFMRAVRENSLRLAFIAAIFVFLTAASSSLILVLAGLWMILLYLYMLLSADFPRPSWKITAVFGITSLLLTLPFISPLILDALNNRNNSFIIEPTKSIQTEIISNFIPSWVIRFNTNVYLGIVPLYLALIATRTLKKQGKLWFLLLGLSFLFAIGPVPLLLGKELDIILPWSLAVSPFLRNMHRMMILFALGWAMITAVGWIEMTRTAKFSRRKMQIAAVIIGLLIYGEYNILPYPTTPVTVSPFYTEYLAQVPDDVVLAILPTGRQKDKRYLYYQSIHGHPMTGGVISRTEEKTFDFIENNPVLRAGSLDLEPTPVPEDILVSFEALAQANVGILVLNKLQLEAPEDWRRAIPFQPIYEDEELLVYSTTAEPTFE